MAVESPNENPLKLGASTSIWDKPLFPGSRLNWEVSFYLLLIIIAALMRFWQLDLRPIHYDESLHALYSWKLLTGEGYQHSAMMHGPFQFHATALVYLLFGDSDYTARLLPTLFGTILVGLPYFLRRQLGRKGALVAAAMLTFSPSLLYLSRFARNDIYIVVWTFVLVICLWRYIDEGRRRYLYLGSAALSLGFCTKEVTFITVVILALFLLALTAREWGSCIQNKLNLSNLSRPATFLLLLATLSLPLFSAGISIFQHQLGVTLASKPWGIPEGAGFTVAASIFIVLLAISVFLGLRWNPRLWLTNAAIFYVIYVLLYTTFFTNLIGLGSGVWCSMSYWLIQHGVERGGQPWYYYLLLLPTYELLPLASAIIGGVYYSLQGSRFSRFLVYWAAMSLILYSWTGEKMPWLIVHITLPLMILGGKFIGDILEKRGWGVTKIATIVIFSILLIFTMRAGYQVNYSQDDTPTEMLVYCQASCDVSRINAEIQRLAEETGEGENLKITVDSSDAKITWPWMWYLRDYKNVDYPNLTSSEQPPRGSVLLLSPANKNAVKPFLGKYGEGEEIREILWFPLEEYLSLNPLDLDTWKRGWDYFTRRQTTHPYISSGAIVYFPRGFDTGMNDG